MQGNGWLFSKNFSTDPLLPIVILDQNISTTHLEKALVERGYAVMRPSNGSKPDGEFVSVCKNYPLGMILTKDRDPPFCSYPRAAVIPSTYNTDDMVKVVDLVYGVFNGTLPNGFSGKGRGFNYKRRWRAMRRSITTKMTRRLYSDAP